MTLRIANACGFWGDSPDAPRRLVESAEVDYLTLEYLAELTMSILARQRLKDPRLGYATDFLDAIRSLLPALKNQSQLRIVTNAGGMNPQACARAVGEILAESNMGDLQIGVVDGDDVTELIEPWSERNDFNNLDDGRAILDAQSQLVSANVYFGGQAISETLSKGARIVITGRVADASLTVGPTVHHFSWQWDDWDRLAGATVAGHLIECGAQVTGGYSTEWANVPDLSNVGYPIAELKGDGSCIITKPPGSGGEVNRRTVVEQLVYEIGDPQRYLTPDVDVDFTTVQVEDQGSDRVAVHGATGCAPPETYKATLVHRDGYRANAQLLVYGADCIAKAKASAKMVFDRIKAEGHVLDTTNVELLGLGDGVPGMMTDSETNTSPPEVVLRLSAQSPSKSAVECFTRQIAPLITSGPAGIAGYAQGRPRVQEVMAHWPTLVPKSLIQPCTSVRSATKWAWGTDSNDSQEQP